LQGDPIGVTVFFIDSGIDTGRRIVLREFIPSDRWNDAGALKNMLFGCDARLYRKALEALMRPGVQFENNDILKGRRYYVVSKIFTQIVDKILSVGANRGYANRSQNGAFGNLSTKVEIDFGQRKSMLREQTRGNDGTYLHGNSDIPCLHR